MIRTAESGAASLLTAPELGAISNSAEFPGTIPEQIMDDFSVFHYPPDLFNLLVDTIPRICRSKSDVLLFFQGAGVPSAFLSDLRADLRRDRKSHNKFDLARCVIVRLNEAGDGSIAARREVLKRVVEFQDFTRCWESDVLTVKGLIAEVRSVVNVKDAFTRINQEREREQQKARAEREAEINAKIARARTMSAVKNDLFALFAESDANCRGTALESVLNRLFAAFGILVRESFRVRLNGVGVVEQIDGAIELDGYLYLVEMKWWGSPMGTTETAQHLVRVFSRAGARGLFISASPYTPAAVQQYREALREHVVILCGLEEIVRLLDAEKDLVAFLRRKADAAFFDKDPFVQVKLD